MMISPLSNIAQTMLSGITNIFSNGTNHTASTPALATSTDSSQLSPFAQLMTTLQQLQQTDPTKFKQVTGELSADLAKAAKTAQQNGNTGEANGLNQLAASFNQASQTGQLPSFLQSGSTTANAGGHHHHHHHHESGGAINQDLNSISQSILSSLGNANTSTGSGTNAQQ